MLQAKFAWESIQLKMKTFVNRPWLSSVQEFNTTFRPRQQHFHAPWHFWTCVQKSGSLSLAVLHVMRCDKKFFRTFRATAKMYMKSVKSVKYVRKMHHFQFNFSLVKNKGTKSVVSL